MRITVEQVPPGGREEDMGRVAVVFPAYNEDRHVAEAVEAALAAGAGRVVCVDDCSTDATGSIIDRLAEDERVRAIHHKVNQGKQAAVKRGIGEAVRCLRSDVFAVLDADMQDDPSLLPGLCHHIGAYDLVIGRRGRGDMPAVRRLSNALANMPYRVLARVAIHDVQSGYRIYSREVAEFLALHLDTRGGYTLEHTSMLLFGKLAAQGSRSFKIAEIEIPYRYAGAESTIRMKDNLQLAWAAVYHAAAIGRLARRKA